MPLIFRSMVPDGNRPKIGPSKSMLGVKAGQDEHDDIAPDGEGKVYPGTGGMSVARAWRELPAHRVPVRLRAMCPKAAGKNTMEIWYHGTGPFESGALSSRLTLRVDKSHHGLVEPAVPMSIDEYQQALADTAEQWVIDPETRSTADPPS